MCLEKAHPTDMFAMIIARIWFRRNKLRLGETMADLRLLNPMARDALLEFQHANISELSPPLA